MTNTKLQEAIDLLYECRDMLALYDGRHAELYKKVWEWCRANRNAAQSSEPAEQSPGLGDPVTYAPRYPSQLPLEGWTVERLPPEPVYVIKHPEGSVIVVAAGEISRNAVKSEGAASFPEPPEWVKCPAGHPYPSWGYCRVCHPNGEPMRGP
jgi:hypothetical protein